MLHVANSTPSASDKHIEKREISDEIAKKKQLRDTLDREIKDLAQARESAILKSGFTPDEYKKAEDEHVKTHREHTEKSAAIRGDISRLEDELKLKREGRDILNIEVQGLEKRRDDLKEAIQRLEHSVGTLEIDEQAHIDNFKKLKASTEAVLAPLRTEVEDLRREYSEKTRDLADRHLKVVEEERLISIKKTDIEIYEDRMRKKYPNETFIL